jgi:DNA polymerase-3 subunit alpha (Gram-positive type)
MSAFDGICSCDEIIKLSKNFNAPAVGFADRGNVQCYPAIAHAADTNKQKILYGIEIDKLQKNINLAINVLPNQNLQNQTYVVFDIETTGLCAIDNDITEFGAVRISNGVVVDKFDTFIKPNQPIPNHIEIKTHITNEMVKNAPPLKKVLPDIVK